jgi:hypothetical protein
MENRRVPEVRSQRSEVKRSGGNRGQRTVEAGKQETPGKQTLERMCTNGKWRSEVRGQEETGDRGQLKQENRNPGKQERTIGTNGKWRAGAEVRRKQGTEDSLKQENRNSGKQKERMARIGNGGQGAEAEVRRKQETGTVEAGKQ